MKRKLLFLLLAFLFSQAPACTRDAELNKQIKELKQEVSDLKKAVETLSKRPSETGKPIKRHTGIDGDPFMGKPGAPLVMVEFSDYECPFCGRFFRETLPQVKKEYVTTGKVKYVYKDFPLNFHKKAPKAAEAAHCAGEKGKFWEMHDLIFNNQMRLGLPALISHAGKLGLNLDDFRKCIDDGRYAEGINKDIEAGQKMDLRGTPSFVIGRQNKEGDVDGIFIEGAARFQAFKTAIDAMLTEK